MNCGNKKIELENFRNRVFGIVVHGCGLRTIRSFSKWSRVLSYGEKWKGEYAKCHM